MSDLIAGFAKMREQGKSQREIVRLLGVPKATVQNAIKRFEETGSNAD